MNALRCFSFTHLAAFYFHFIAIVHCILHEPWKWDKEKKRVKYLIWLNVELISFKLLLCLAFNRQVNTELKLSLQKDSLKIRGKFCKINREIIDRQQNIAAVIVLSKAIKIKVSVYFAIISYFLKVAIDFWTTPSTSLKRKKESW